MNPRRTTLLAMLLLTGVLASLPATLRAQEAMEPLSAFPTGALQIRTEGGSVLQFGIWVADRPARQQQGLMFVRELPEHQGMLFVYEEDRLITMWMKNTLIPLDMLFIRADGTIAHIAARTQPRSLAIIGSPVPVRAVLELAGGTAEDFGIHPGDRVFADALPAARHPHPATRRKPAVADQQR